MMAWEGGPLADSRSRTGVRCPSLRGALLRGGKGAMGDRGDRFLPGDEKRSAAGPDSGHHSGSFDQPDEHQAWKYGHALRRSGRVGRFL